MSASRPASSPRPRPGFAVPESELSWQFSRSSGPGGQHVNTTDSQVELRWDVAASAALPAPLKERALARLAGRLTGDGVLVVRASTHRSQWRNRQEAVDRLGALVEEALAPPPPRRRPTRKSRGVVERRLAEKKRRGDLKRGRGGRHGDGY